METLRAGVREDLTHNVANTARSHDSVTVLYDLDVRLFIEPPPRLATALQHQLLVGNAEAAFTSAIRALHAFLIYEKSIQVNRKIPPSSCPIYSKELVRTLG